MGKILIAILVILVILVIIAIVGGVGYATGIFRAPELEGIVLSWGEVTSETTTINAGIEVNNRLPFGVGSGAIAVEMPIYIYDVKMAQFDLPGLSIPRGRSTLESSALLTQTNLPQWWPDFVSHGEVLALRMEPRISVRILGRTFSGGLPNISSEVSVPIMSRMRGTEPVTIGFDDATLLEIVQDPGRHFISSPPQPSPALPVLTMESWELRWGTVTPQSTQVLGTIVLRNELPLPVPTQGLSLALDMNGISMLSATVTPADSVLPPGQSVSLLVESNLDNGKLVQWWTSHLQQGERTEARARIGVNIVLPETGLPGIPIPVSLSLVPILGFRCDVRTDILGVANYQIVREIGGQIGEQPQGAQIQCTVLPAELSTAAPSG